MSGDNWCYREYWGKDISGEEKGTGEDRGGTKSRDRSGKETESGGCD